MIVVRQIKCLSNLQRLDGVKTERYQATSQFAGDDESFWGGVRLFFSGQGQDVVVLTGGTWRVVGWCLMKWLFPFAGCKLVAVDFILSRPQSWSQALLVIIKSLMLRKVDRFVLHFKDTSEYQRYYGIPAEKCIFVPFKVNYWERLPSENEISLGEDYVFTAGRSYRDYPSFIEAMRQVSYPGLFLYEDLALHRQAASDVDLVNLPKNLRAIKNVGELSWVDYIRRAKVVVVPLLPSTMYAPGLSLYLMAMALKKCVIITEGLATRGMLTNEVVMVPPQDPRALADAIRLVWDDNAIRQRTAESGRRYAKGCGGELRLLTDIVNICGDLCSKGSERN